MHVSNDSVFIFFLFLIQAIFKSHSNSAGQYDISERKKKKTTATEHVIKIMFDENVAAATLNLL